MIRFKLGKSNGSGRQRHVLGRHVEIVRQRVADDFGLLVNFLRHEMAVVALVDQASPRLATSGRRAHDRLPWRRGSRHAVAGDDDPVAVLEIGDRVGERRQRDGVGAENISPSP